MSNLGKKSKTTKATAAGTGISRLVTNLQTLPKRKSLLVIETGFPTSLIDLFIKSTFSKEGHHKTKTKTNSGNSNKRKKKTPKSGSAIPPASIPRDPPVAPVVGPPEMEAIPDRRDSCEQSCRGIEFGGLGDADAVSGSNNSVVFAVLKVSLAAVLALGTEKLTVGITMSACLLLSLEYLGKRFSRFHPRIPTDLISESVASSSSSSSCASVDEIETVGDSVVSGAEIHQVRQGSDVPNVPRRGGKLRSNIMKRLFPKKLHGGSKRGKGEEAEKCTEVEAMEVRPALPSSPPREESKSAADEPLQENAEAVSDGGEVAAGKRLTSKRGSGYLLSVLVLIVISGLFWGRILAFLLAIGWCLLLKFVDLFCGLTSPPSSII